MVDSTFIGVVIGSLIVGAYLWSGYPERICHAVGGVGVNGTTYGPIEQQPPILVPRDELD